MKRKIVLRAYGDKNWIGGVYYIKNIAYQLSTNNHITDNFDIIIVTSKENEQHFIGLPQNIKIKCIGTKSSKIRKIMLAFFMLANRVKYVYPMSHSVKSLNICGINWIPDFQHNYYSEYFSTDEIARRNAAYSTAQTAQEALVLSSNTCKNDFIKFYGNKQNLIVMPFVSYIKPEICGFDDNTESVILKKYGLSDRRFVCVSNQFWKHKNHIIVLKAIKKLFDENRCSDLMVVFTGQLKDYRNPDYIEEVTEMLRHDALKNKVKLLGFIDRLEQLVIMKNSEFVIQPSKFEGWGTVVEDAKVLDKTILLSDIPVHREQKNDKCKLFGDDKVDELAELIADEWAIEHSDNIESGINDMHERAVKYSKAFESAIFK